MLTRWLALLVSDDAFAAAVIFSLTGLDGPFWLITKATFDQIVEVLALAM